MSLVRLSGSDLAIFTLLYLPFLCICVIILFLLLEVSIFPSYCAFLCCRVAVLAISLALILRKDGFKAIQIGFW